MKTNTPITEYCIISDGSLDISPELAAERDITVVPFYVSFDNEHYYKENVELNIRKFYNQMIEQPNVFPKTSMPSVQDYFDVFLPKVQKNIPIICICISTKFSGSMQSALSAKDLILEEYPDAMIEIIDATINTVLQGIFVLEATYMRDLKIPYTDAVKRLEEMKSTGRIFFTVGNMDYLKHGGRIGKLTGIAGSMLGIKPLITLQEGEIFPSGITRSRKKSMTKIINLLLDYLRDNHCNIDDYSIVIGFGYDYEEACSFRDLVITDLNKNNYTIQDIPIYQIGATIGVHTGPYPIGIAIVQKHNL